MYNRCRRCENLTCIANLPIEYSETGLVIKLKPVCVSDYVLRLMFTVRLGLRLGIGIGVELGATLIVEFVSVRDGLIIALT